jgi:hypothetical protein
MVDSGRLFATSEAEYGDHYRSDLLTQFRDYVASADQVSERRHKANQFFSTLNSVLLAATGFLPNSSGSSGPQLQVALAGILLCVIWYYTIIAHRNLNSAKFNVIQEIEQRLPLAVYSAEWDRFKAAQGGSKPMTFTSVESAVPWLFASIYALMFLWGAFTGMKILPGVAG